MSVVTRVYGSGSDMAIDASIGRLKHLHRALALYRSEYGDGSIVGGLPDRAYVYETYLGFSHDYFVSPCSGRRGFVTRSEGVSYAYTWAEARLATFETLGLLTPIFVDLDCTPNRSQGRQKLGLAILLNGTATRREKPGDPNDLNWWVERP